MHLSVSNLLAQPGGGGCRVKICGLRSVADVLFCAENGADAVGLNFWRHSKRYVEPCTVQAWLPDLPGTLARVGVFVNEDREEILRLLESGVIHAAQLHGDEDPRDCDYLRSRGFGVLKAIAVRDESSLERIARYEVDGIVLDAFCPGAYGGGGKTFDWRLALQAKRLLGGTTPLILSGGLTPRNVAAAIKQTEPSAVDVASGVESEPGVKSPDKMSAFLEAVRDAAGSGDF